MTRVIADVDNDDYDDDDDTDGDGCDNDDNHDDPDDNYYGIGVGTNTVLLAAYIFGKYRRIESRFEYCKARGDYLIRAFLI